MSIYCSKTYLEDLDNAIDSSVGIERIKDSSVLITGASGTIGAFIVDVLMRYNQMNGGNIKIYAMGRSLERLEKRFGDIKHNNIFFVEQDIRKQFKLNIEFDYIIHAAGNAYPAAFNEDPVGTIIGNIMGTYQLLEYSNKIHARKFVYISSGEIYGKMEKNIKEFEEDKNGYLDITSCRSCYPISKRAVENLCISFMQQYGLNVAIVRPSHTYGPTITKKDNRAIVQFINNALRGEDIILKSEGTQMRSYTYVADCVSAILSVLAIGNSGEAYNISNPESVVTIAELAGIIASLSNKKTVLVNPTSKEMQERSPIERQILSSKKIEKLGWKANYDIRTGIEHLLRIVNEKSTM